MFHVLTKLRRNPQVLGILENGQVWLLSDELLNVLYKKVLALGQVVFNLTKRVVHNAALDVFKEKLETLLVLNLIDL